MVNLPKYTKDKMKGNIGEAFVQYVLSKFCLVHKIDGSNDIGNDMICELIKEEYPTNLLFYVQVKYTNRKPTIKKETLEYWKNSPIPVYIFWVKDQGGNGGSGEEIRADFEKLKSMATYRRCTPIVHGELEQNTQEFKHFERRNFLKDLIVDFTKCQYAAGFVPVISPRDFLSFGEKIEIGFQQQVLYVEDIKRYQKNILKNGWSNLFGIAVSLCERWEKDKNEEDRKRALQLVQLAKQLLSGDYENSDRFSGILNEYENKLRVLNNYGQQG